MAIFLFDALLVGFGVYLVYRTPDPLASWQVAAVLAAFGIGAWIGVLPFLKEYDVAARLHEHSEMAEALNQLQDVSNLTTQVSVAASRLDQVQETCANTVASADAIAKRMHSEAKGFTEFMNRAEDTQKQGMRLEVDKLRRSEGELVQTVTMILDHTFALHQAGLRSGQENLIRQLGTFRNACIESTRRIGLVTHEAKPGDGFEDRVHQSIQDPVPSAGTPILGTIACGYTYQGQGIRRIVVALDGDPQPQNQSQE